MSLLFWATTFDFTGKILIIVMALLVHKRVKIEHRIDKKVLREMKLEQGIGILAIILLTLGYVLHLYSL